jgi:hypothetical protein
MSEYIHYLAVRGKLLVVIGNSMAKSRLAQAQGFVAVGEY